MSGSELRDRHLTPEEMVAHVFPTHDGAAPVPLHLSVCRACQSKAARLRESFLLDKGAIEGVMEEIPAPFWEEQAAAVMAKVREEVSTPAGIASFPYRWKARVLRRPVLAAASLAAAVVLVAGLTLLRPHTPAPASAEPQVAHANLGGFTEAADVRDDELLRSIDASLSEEIPFRSLIPEEV